MEGSAANSDEDTKIKFRSELANMSFEELQKLKQHLGTKVYNEAMYGVESKKKKYRFASSFKRENKNRPREMSSKKPVPLLKEAVKSKESTTRDPRFDSLCGTYNASAFKRSYDFIKEIKDTDLVKLKEELEHTTNPKRREQIKYLIQRMENQNREEKRQTEKLAKKQHEYQERIKQVKEGKNPVYVKKSEKKVQDLVEQYEQLKQSGKLGKHISKHRKRNLQREKKKAHIGAIS